jgi:RHS repeat-associated protein
VPQLQLTNLHGDIVATADDTTDAVSTNSTTDPTEYGVPRDPSATQVRYGWVGGKRRSSDDLADLVLMGVRLYNPATGRFLSVDPVVGGIQQALENS